METEEAKFIAMNIVNQLFDMACLDVDTRQKINDVCDSFVKKLIDEYAQQLQAENERLKEEIQKNGYNLRWHRCSHGIRPYSQVYCSGCFPLDENKDFNPLKVLQDTEQVLKD